MNQAQIGASGPGVPETTQQLPTSNSRHRGPSLLLVALVHAVLFMASLVISTALAQGQHFPSPFGTGEQSLRFFAEHAPALRIMALLQFGAAIPLGILAASASSRLQFLGMKVAGINIALYGGVAASISLMISACALWVLGQLQIADAGASSVRALHLLCFAAGGPGYVVPFGLLIAGIALVGGLQGFLPRWLMASGLVIALIAELSFLTFVLPGAAYLLPIARFPGLVWLVVASALLPKMKNTARLSRAAAGT